MRMAYCPSTVHDDGSAFDAQARRRLTSTRVAANRFGRAGFAAAANQSVTCKGEWNARLDAMGTAVALR